MKGRLTMNLNDKQKESKIEKIGKLLLFFCFGITVLGPVLSSFILFTNYGMIQNYFNQFPSLFILTIIDTVIGSGLIVFSIYAGISIWMIRPKAVKFAKMYLLIYSGYKIIIIIFSYFIILFLSNFPPEAGKAMAIINIKNLLSSSIFVIIWYSYFNNSKRVRTLFGITLTIADKAKSLTITNVKKIFGMQEVLKGVSLAVEPGEFLVLVGPSGCGKSTLLNLIAGLETITEGEIKIGDEVVNNVMPKDRNIAMVFQSYALYPNMNVKKNLEFGLETREVRSDQIDEIVQKIADMLQISELLNRKPSQLSGGQRQRVAMGRALVRNPAVFLFDEPLSNLDAKLRVEMRTEIKMLHQRIKTTIVYVTHDQIEAMTLADRIAVMKDGFIHQFDTPQQVYDNPSTLFVAGFIGSPSMNFIPCKLIRKDKSKGVLLETNKDKVFFMPIENSKSDLDNWVDKDVIIGIRPERIASGFYEQEGNTLMHEIECKVEVLEPTGPDTLIFVNINGTKVTCRVNPNDVKLPGESMKLMIDMSKVLLFDPKTEKQI